MKLTFALFLLFYSANIIWSQSERLDLSVYEEIELSEKFELMEKVKNDFPFYTRTEGWPNEFVENFHFFDIDGDKDKDLIYDGWSGGEPMMICIYLNKGEHFDLLLRQYSNIENLKYKDNILYQVIIEEPGCCMPIYSYSYIYEFEKQGDDFYTYITEKIGWHLDTQEPQSYFSSPISFEVINTPYSLRVSPKILNEGFHFLDIEGNLINSYKKGDTGIAIAEQADSTGRIWWYVIMDNTEKRESFTKNSHTFPMKYKGWMSSRCLKKSYK